MVTLLMFCYIIFLVTRDKQIKLIKIKISYNIVQGARNEMILLKPAVRRRFVVALRCIGRGTQKLRVLLPTPAQTTTMYESLFIIIS